MATLLDWGKAKAFTLGMRSILGSEPEIIDYGDYLEISFSPQQQEEFRAYLDSVVKRKILPGQETELPTIQIRFGEVLVPWGVKYLLPAFVGTFLAGLFLGKIR